MEFKKEYSNKEIQHIIKKLNQYEQSFHDTSSILKNIAESIPQYIYWKDTHSVYLGCNTLFANLVGFESPEQLVGKTDYDLDWQSTGHTAESFQKDDKATMAGRPVANKEEILSLPNGKSLITIVSKRPIVDRGKVVGVIGLFTDVTELSQAKKRAEFSSQAKSEFIANMSHDLRTPISGMLAMIHDLLNTVDHAKSSSGDIQSRQNSTLDYIIETVERDGHYLMSATDELLHLFNEILEVVRLESGKSTHYSESFNLKDIVEHNIELLKPTAHHKKLHLSYDIHSKLPTYLYGYRHYLDRILLNLISNALKFTEKGMVNVSIKPFNKNTASHKVGETIPIEIHVEDTGIGIPKDKFETIFEHFARLTPSYDGLYKGAGLGLYTVNRYVQAMNGSIEVTSELGKGSCFKVILPFTISDHSDSAKESFSFPKSTKPMTDKKTFDNQKTVPVGEARASILIVEDHPLAAIGVQLVLKPFHCHIEIAKNGTEALAMAKKGYYDLILMDIGLPDFSGIEVAKKIRAFSDVKKSQVPIVALTGHANNPEIRQDVLEVGMQEVLSKPAQPLALESVLQNYVFKAKLKKQFPRQRPTAMDQIPKSLVVIDWDACFRICNEDPEFTRKMLSMMNDDLTHLKMVLAEAYLNRDTKKLREELHRTRGGACYLKLPELEKTLKLFHEAVKEVPQDPDRLEKTYAALLQAIDNFKIIWGQKFE